MNVHVLRNTTNGKVIATRIARASNFWTRGVGLLGHGKVSPDEGLWIDGCSAVHTMGMRATIDLYFLDAERRVVRIVEAVKPNRLAVACRSSEIVVELGVEPQTARSVSIGDQLALE